MVKVSFAPDTGFKERVEGGGVRRRANTGTSAVVRRCLSPSLLLSSPVEEMFFLWADRLPNANIVTRLRCCSLPSRPFGKNNETSSFWALPHYGSIWHTHTHTHHFLSLPMYTSSVPNTHTLYLCNAQKAHSATLLHCSLTPSPARAHTHGYTPFGCNKTADQSHWLLTGTDSETCCCWKAAWEMFITHKACRFGQERNNGLIKWRPGAAEGEIHTHPHAHPHGLRESLKPWLRPSALIGWEKLGLPEKCKTFPATVEFAEFGVWCCWQTRQIVTWRHLRRQTARPERQERKSNSAAEECDGLVFTGSLPVLIGVSDVCLAHCITLTRRDSIFPTSLNLKPCFHSNSALRLSKHSPPDWL